jgi:hypothetical protein
MIFKTSYHSKKSVEPIKSYEQFSKSIYGWECQKNAILHLGEFGNSRPKSVFHVRECDPIPSIFTNHFKIVFLESFKFPFQNSFKQKIPDKKVSSEII